MRDDKSILLYSGALGHPFVVVVNDKEDGRRCGAEVNTLERALEYAVEMADSAPTIYKRRGKGWAKVRGRGPGLKAPGRHES